MRLAPALLSAVLALGSACRTSGTQTAAAALDSREAAAFIQETVRRYFPAVAAADPVVAAFAEALLDRQTEQAQTPGEVLGLYAEHRRAVQTDLGTPLERYIVEEFLVLTNYIAVAAKESDRLQLTVVQKS